MDCQEYHSATRDELSKIRLIYAGSPAKKDYLDECIKGYNLISPELKEVFEFHIMGADESFVHTCCGGIIPNGIIAHGQVPRQVVIKMLEICDFAILRRPKNERYTKSGFPTKSVEAMMNGCAMICNIISDLALYLVDGYNAIIVDDCSYL